LSAGPIPQRGEVRGADMHQSDAPSPQFYMREELAGAFRELSIKSFTIDTMYVSIAGFMNWVSI
jgi:hypothetical protein